MTTDECVPGCPYCPDEKAYVTEGPPDARVRRSLTPAERHADICGRAHLEKEHRRGKAPEGGS